MLMATALLMTALTILPINIQAVSEGAPGTPTGSPGVGYIDVTWTAAPGSPQGYFVYWSTVSGTVQISGNTGSPVTSYRVATEGAPNYNNPLPAGYTLYFQICAYYGASGGTPYYYSGWSSAYTSADYPTAPQNLDASVNDGNVTLTWTAPTSNGGVALTNYKIYRSTNSGTEVQVATVGGATLVYEDDTVAGNQTYYYKVAAFNGYISPLSNEVSAILPSGRPGMVDDLQCLQGVENITLSWDAPELDGGFPITDYQIYRSTISGEEILLGSTGGANCTYVDNGMEVGRTYYYQVTALNSEAESAPCAEVEIDFVALPGPAQDLRADVSPYAIMLEWDTPASDGGSPIIGYDIYRRNVTSDSEWGYYDYTDYVQYYNDTNVQLGCTYQYKITTWNGDWLESPFSDVLEVQYVVPSEPFNIAANANGHGTLSVTWQAPNSTGGRALTGYMLYWGTEPFTYSSSMFLGVITSYSLSGLEDSTTYYITLAAVTACGPGPQGTQAVATTAEVPGDPEDLSLTAGDSQVTLNWSPPSDNGGSGITMYKIYRSIASGGESFLTNCGANCTWIDAHLVNGQTYYYRVSAVNAVGEGAFCDEASVVPARLPTNPTVLSATGGLQNITVTWNAPTDMGGGITGYDIYRGTTDNVLDMDLLVNLGNVTSYVDTVAKGTTWYYRVVAHNWAGYSGYSNSWQATSYIDPAPVNGLAATAYVGYVHLAWSEPASDSPILGYYLYRGTATGSLTQFQTLGPVAFYNDTAVTNGQTYYYKVRAYSAVGEGNLSDEVTAIPSRAPDAPTGLEAVRGDGQVSLSWSAPEDDGGSAIIGYAIYVGATSSSEVYYTTVAGTFCVVDALTNGQAYFFKVTAVNVRGNGTMSSEASAVPAAVPGQPTDLVAAATIGKIVLSWSAPADDGGLPVIVYNVYRGTDLSTMVKIATTASLAYADENGTMGTSYVYEVSAVNAEGEGRMASLTSASLWPPPAPNGLQVVREGSSAVLTWTMPESNATSGTVTGFAIYRGNDGIEVLIGYANSSDATSFTDADAPIGETTYRVAALNGDMAGGSSISSPDSLSAENSSMGSWLPLAVFGVIGAILLLFIVIGRKKEDRNR